MSLPKWSPSPSLSEPVQSGGKMSKPDEDSSLSTYEPKLMQPQPQQQELLNTTSKKMGRVSKKLAQRASGYPYDLKQKRKLRKNNREKQRRSELNVKFERLCTLLGRQSKAEKYTILTDAINLIGELRHENQELKIEKIGLCNELVSASVGPGVSEAELQEALLVAFPDAPALPVDLTPPGSPELGHRHYASSDDSDDDDEGSVRGQDYSSKLDGVAGLTMGSPPLKSGLSHDSFQGYSRTLPPSHLSLSNFSNLLYKQSPAFLHPQSFSPFPSSFGPSFAPQYNPAMNFHGMMPLTMPSLDNLNPISTPPETSSRSSPHINTVLALAPFPARPFSPYPIENPGQTSFNMDQREDPHGHTFLSF